MDYAPLQYNKVTLLEPVNLGHSQAGFTQQQGEKHGCELKTFCPLVSLIHLYLDLYELRFSYLEKLSDDRKTPE